ncbi:MAG: tetratricopeptide repeat protein [Hyphomicrobiaceae bacterium]
MISTANSPSLKQLKPSRKCNTMKASQPYTLILVVCSLLLSSPTLAVAQYQNSEKKSKPANASDAAWSCATSDQAVRTIRLCTPKINDPKTSTKRRIRYLMKRAKAWVVEAELWAAVNDYSRVHELDPKNTKSLHEQGKLYISLNEHELAIESYSKLIALNPEDAAAICQRATSKLAIGKTAEALKDYDIAKKAGDPTAKCAVGLGNVYAKQGDHKSALREYTAAIELDTRHWNAYYRRAEIFKKLGNNDLAIAEYSRVLQLNSVNIYARHQLRDLGVREPYP